MRLKILYSILLLSILPSSLSAQDNFYSYTLKDFRDATIFQEIIDVDNPDLERINAVVFYLTNEIRSNEKLLVLKHNPYLDISAELHSQSMVDSNFFGHTNHTNKKLEEPKDRAQIAGISNPHLAENIIQIFILRYEANKGIIPEGNGVFRYPNESKPIQPHTYLSMGEKMLKDWMNSPGHKKNIINKDAIELGCGTAYYPRKHSNDIPMLVVTQNFQLYEPVQITK